MSHRTIKQLMELILHRSTLLKVIQLIQLIRPTLQIIRLTQLKMQHKMLLQIQQHRIVVPLIRHHRVIKLRLISQIPLIQVLRLIQRLVI